MTVIIPGVIPDLKRALDTQARTPSTPSTQSDSAPASTASLPTDTVATTATPREPLNVEQATQESAAQNLVAAQSTLSDDDLDAFAPTLSPQAQVQAQTKASVAAQTNRLAPSMLQLLVE